MKVQLYAYLGIDEQGKLELCVSTDRLNTIGTRLEKGTPLPRSVKEFDGFVNYNHDTPMDQVGALQDLQDYLNNQVKEKKRK